MALSIGGNYGMLRSLNNLRSTQSKMNKAIERISSGLRINSAADDAGGLAMGMKLSNEATIASNLQNSVENGKSFVDAQFGALDSAEQIVSEMKLVKQKYDSASATDKATYQDQFDELQSQLTSLTQESFSGEALFGNTSKEVSTNADGSNSIEIGEIDLGAAVSSVTAAVDLSDPAASAALDTNLDAAHDQVTSLVAKVGGNSSTLGFASSYLESKAANLEAARSRVMDADIAEESMNLSKYTMQYEAGVAALAQANSTQQTVMELLLFNQNK